ncbi:MAG: hypothetical protein E7002_02970 [Denitrobacterium detoxificans]|nr:hypothetical protein [Denitrobacterium detoxificans]
MSDKEAIEQAIEIASTRDGMLKKVVDELSGSSRRARQNSAAVVAGVAKKNPSKVVPYVDQIVDALNRPEAQTRWECLNALTEIVALESRVCDKAIPGAETALFDEDSGPAHLAAMRFLCKLGSTTENRSEKTWPLIDEAIQCYHGDIEFQEMLVAVIGFSEGKLAPAVKEELKARMEFDSKNGKGALKHRAQQIIDNLS